MQASRHKRPFRLIPILALASALAGLALLPAPAAEAKVRFEIRGHGFGHGVGMSQWGAYGLAQRGQGHRKILAHYYRRTKLGRAGSERVRVLLSSGSGTVGFGGAVKACGTKLNPGRSYRASVDGRGRNVRLERGNGKRITGCGRRLSAQPKGILRIDGIGSYHGKLVARPGSSGLNVINNVAIDAYAKGVVPSEVPASWPAAALRAQAVAARSYALATRVGGDGYDLYDDTRSQVYLGVGGEQSSTSRAVRRTAGQVLTYRGKVIPTYFFSSSGGRTENVEFGFAGASSKPYLRSVPDPADEASPYSSWKLTYSQAEMQSRLSEFVKGKLRRIEIVKTGASPRIVKAKVVGSGGRTTVSGDELRFQLGLRSTWARFKRISR